MATQLQLRSGTTLQNDIFTGASGELTYDTEKNQVRIHDGQTVGGFVLASSGSADFVVAWQAPTEANEYKWYRKYKSGWVEQGGQFGDGTTGVLTVTLPIVMSDTNYNLIVSANVTDGSYFGTGYKVSTTEIKVWTTNHAGNTVKQTGSSWQVSGMAA
jgi:hypothetical protein